MRQTDSPSVSCALHGTKVSFSTSLMNARLRLPKLSSQWRTWMRFSSRRRSVIPTDCRSHTHRRSEWGICLFITKMDRCVHLLLQSNRPTRSVCVVRAKPRWHSPNHRSFSAACLTHRRLCLYSTLSEQRAWHTCKRNTQHCETSM